MVESIDKPAQIGSKRSMTEQYLSNSFQFQFNEIKGLPEFKTINSREDFKSIDDYRLHSLVRWLDASGINASANLVKEILSSNFNPIVNPVKEYFENLSTTGTDHIKTLAGTVTTTTPEDFYPLFKKWLVASVASAMDDKIINHTCLVFTGDKQGQFKTTWLNLLCPPQLDEYHFCGEIVPDNKDTLALLTENFIINIDDQIHKLNRKDENALKNLITSPFVKYRRPYDKYITKHARIASFCASINGNEFLADTTGSRRFLPFQILDIDINKAQKINMNLVYSYAKKLLNDGFQYWFDKSEIDELNKRNAAFNIVSIEEQLLLETYSVTPPEDKYPDKLTLQPATILNQLEVLTKQKLSLKKVGEAMKRHGFEKVQRKINGSVTWVYEVYKIN